MRINLKKILFGILILFLIITVSTLLEKKQIIQAQAEDTVHLSGWAWSSNIGWIDFSTSTYNPEGVFYSSSDYDSEINGYAHLYGYAWSSNIGWIKFGDLSEFPALSGTMAVNAQIGRGTKAPLIGWARACSGTIYGDCSDMTDHQNDYEEPDGWDGWISLGGTDYGVKLDNNAKYSSSSYAWGNEVVGWVDFGKVKRGEIVYTTDGVCGSDIQDVQMECSATQKTDPTDDVLCDVGSSTPLSVAIDKTDPTNTNYRYTWKCKSPDGGLDSDECSKTIDKPICSDIGECVDYTGQEPLEETPSTVDELCSVGIPDPIPPHTKWSPTTEPGYPNKKKYTSTWKCIGETETSSTCQVTAKRPFTSVSSLPLSARMVPAIVNTPDKFCTLTYTLPEGVIEGDGEGDVQCSFMKSGGDHSDSDLSTNGHQVEVGSEYKVICSSVDVTDPISGAVKTTTYESKFLNCALNPKVKEI